MKMEATCGTCKRRFLLSQIGEDSDAPGRCPFCGAHFAKHYSTVLVDAVRDTEAGAAFFARSLDRLEDMETGFAIDYEALFAELKKQIGRPAEGHVA
jgi:DNA-directed RNA polymerase subunit RPC12/RpoP